MSDILDIGGFAIEKRIGAGACSTIYLATDSNRRQVALKRIIVNKPEDLRAIEQTEAEWKIASKIDHPYIRKCFKFKKIRSLLKIKEAILSMEYFPGKSLEETPSLSLIDVLLIFRMIASGLNAMHHQGFVHCDIKPNNILIDRKNGSIKIIDLGQSCKIGTVKKRIQGTPDYIAPEQVLRKPLGPRTDIFNLGATMYWALTGKNIPTMIPKKDKYGRTIVQKRIAPHVVRPQIPVALSKLVMNCAEDDPADRPTSMLDVSSCIDKLIHSLLGKKPQKNKNLSDDN